MYTATEWQLLVVLVILWIAYVVVLGTALAIEHPREVTAFRRVKLAGQACLQPQAGRIGSMRPGVSPLDGDDSEPALRPTQRSLGRAPLAATSRGNR